MSDAWGFLGRPPKSVLDGTSEKMDRFHYYQREIEKARKIANGRQRTIKMHEVRAHYLREFPQEKDNG